MQTGKVGDTMSTRSGPGNGAPDPGLSAIMGERRQLLDLAYRLLGSLADAEDAVQETYARWYAMSREQQDAIESPGAWLTKVASRICLDLLGSARARRERYVGEWIPEPLPEPGEWMGSGPGGSTADPADRVTLDESVSMAFLVVLESMTPAERVAFVLHDVFGYPFPEVAEITGRTPAACRQLASSARRRISAAQPPATPAAQRADVVRDFRQAWEAKDINALISLLDPGATAIADGGGLVAAALAPIQGGEQIARYLADIAFRAPGLTILERTVNGQPGLVLQHGGVTAAVFAFDITAGRITRIWAVRNPDKLRPWTASLRRPATRPTGRSGNDSTIPPMPESSLPGENEIRPDVVQAILSAMAGNDSAKLNDLLRSGVSTAEYVEAMSLDRERPHEPARRERGGRSGQPPAGVRSHQAARRRPPADRRRRVARSVRWAHPRARLAAVRVVRRAAPWRPGRVPPQIEVPVTMSLSVPLWRPVS